MKGRQHDCGPVVTISRQTGCDAVAVARSLAGKLNRRYETSAWHWIDKEVLMNAARQLETDTSRVESYIAGHELSGLSEMLMAVSGRFVSDMKVRKVIREVLLTICNEGEAIIVGRGGVSVAHKVVNSLHIRLVAPFYWRVENIMKKRNLTIEEAEEFVVDTDEKRYNLIVNFMDKKPLNLDYLFDATINRSSYSVDQIAEIITVMYGKRVEAIKNLSQDSELMKRY
ncbi:MAG: cytidylate kinase-like family protein [Bacteroidales bacterium]|nr:cytidylate kinase-like family protein [Bacteroidales bacterium]